MLQRAGTAPSDRGALPGLAAALLCAWLTAACSGTLASGVAPPAVAFPGGVVWQSTLVAAPAHPPAYDDRQAYVALKDGTVVALDHASGLPAWTSQIAASVPPVCAGRLLIAADGTRAWAIDTSSGNVRWQQALPAPAARAPVVTARGALFATSAGDAVLLALDDGTLLWRQSVGAAPVSMAAGRADRAYLGLEDGRVVAMAAATGSVAWTRKLPGAPLALTPLNDRIYVGSADRFLYSLKEKNGGVAWRWRTGGSVTAQVAASAKRIYFASRDATLRALDRRHGDLRWQRPLRARAVGAPLLAGETVIAAGVSPELRGFRTADGGAAGVVPIPGWAVDGPFLAPPAGSVPARVLVATAGGQMLAIGQTTEPPIVPLDIVPGRRLAAAARPPAR